MRLREIAWDCVRLREIAWDCVQAPPTFGDFDGDGILDVIISSRTSYYGLRVTASAGAGGM